MGVIAVVAFFLRVFLVPRTVIAAEIKNVVLIATAVWPSPAPALRPILTQVSE
jgi:hypothetical protein